MFSTCLFVCLFLHSFVRLSITKLVKQYFANELNLLHISTSGPQGNGINGSALGVGRSKVKVTGGRNRSDFCLR